MVGRVTLRTLFFDARIAAALEGKDGPAARQVVLLGAGMDTRAWRLKMPAGGYWALLCPSFPPSRYACCALILHQLKIMRSLQYSSISACSSAAFTGQHGHESHHIRSSTATIVKQICALCLFVQASPGLRSTGRT
jgi:hypothetical protein